MELEILLNKNMGDTLNKEELEFVDEIKKYTYEFMNDDPVDNIHYDMLYAYAKLLKNGIVKDSRKIMDSLFQSILYHGLSGYDPDTLFDRYPILLEYVDKVSSSLDLDQLVSLSTYYKLNKDYDNFFKICKLGADYKLERLRGGIELVDSLIRIDHFKYETAYCYIYGKGTKVNYASAFQLFLEYRRDHLVYRNGADYFTEEDLSYLYNKMMEDYKSGKRYPGLYYALAVMNREGIGTNYNPLEYKRYSLYGLKEYEGKDELLEEEKQYFSLLSEYVGDHTINNENNGEEITDLCTLDNIEVGKTIELGKYDHRSILWEVLDIKKDKVLLLSRSVLDTIYPLINQSDFLEDSLKHFKQNIYFKNKMKYELKYLTTKEVNKYLSKDEKLCFSRKQAQISGAEGMGVDVDYTTGFAKWYTSSKTGKNEPFVIFVDYDGEYDLSLRGVEYVGLRPAMWLKLKGK